MFWDIDEVRAAIDRHGWCVPCVLPDVPAGVTWAYTVGMTEADLPELIVFGEWPDHAHAILSRTRDQLLRSRDRARAGEHLGTVHTRFGDCEARLGAVSLRWVDRFPLWASELYGPDVRVLQVVLSHGPDAAIEPEDAIDLAHAQPDLLSNAGRPWRTPFFGTGWWDHPDGPDIFVLVPIRCAGEDEHRDEAVLAERLDATTARLRVPPVLADHVTAGATVRIEPEPDGLLDHPPGGSAPTHRLAAVTDPGPNLQLSFAVTADPDDGEPALRAISGLLDRFDAPASVAPGSVHLAVAPRHAEPARIAFRRLQRDGLVSALDLYHEPNVFTDHPDCPQCRRRRGG